MLMYTYVLNRIIFSYRTSLERNCGFYLNYIFEMELRIDFYAIKNYNSNLTFKSYKNIWRNASKLLRWQMTFFYDNVHLIYYITLLLFFSIMCNSEDSGSWKGDS